jgi:glycosyltransferase involved in cell wall biosynthesis
LKGHLIKVLHVITDLYIGGAEVMLYNLLRCTDRKRFAPRVISLRDRGLLDDKIRALGVGVQALGMRPYVPNPWAMLRLARWLRQNPPHVIQTWMYHADLIGGMASKLAGGIPVAWGLHNSNLDPQHSKRATLWTVKACARLSHRLPTRIICCSEASCLVHSKLGYAAERMIVIPNGLDLDTFRPDPVARLSVRQELKIPEETILIGLVGRFDPQKDHGTFIQAAALLHAELPEVHFLLCGSDVIWANKRLSGWIDQAGIRSCCHLLGRRDDIPRLQASLDIACSSSAYGEAFSLAIGEAMACGVPCVVTDVGDSALLVGDTGKVVPPRDLRALAAAWGGLIEMGREGRNRLGRAARQRIEEHFSLSAIVARYEAIYEELAAHR